VSRSVRGSKREAQAALAGLLVEVRQGRSDHQGTDATIKDLVEQWLDLRRDTLSVTTYEGYVAKARHRLLPALGEVSVRKLTVRDIDVFYRVLARDLGLAGSTVRQIHNVLTGSLDQAVRWGWRNDNPAKLATLPPARQAEVRPPSPADVLAAISAADLEFSTFLRVSASVGGSRGEVAALRWSNIDLDAGELVISRSLVERADLTIIEKDTKTHQARRVAIDPGTVEALRTWRAELEHVARSPGCPFARTATSSALRRRLGALAPVPLDERLAAAPGEGRHRPHDPSSRPSPLRRHPAARCRRAGEDRERSSRPCPASNHPQRLRPLHPASDRAAADAMGEILSLPARGSTSR